jgi:hypothetical protein
VANEDVQFEGWLEHCLSKQKAGRGDAGTQAGLA